MKLSEIKPGDVVVVKGQVDSPVMTVDAIEVATADCIWFSKLRDGYIDTQRAEINVAALELHKSERPTVVCLCGSTKFKEQFEAANLRETLAGKIVLSVGGFLHLSSEDWSSAKPRLDELHKRKIDMADEVLVLNVGCYVGESTKSEIAYAKARGKKLRWLEPVIEEPIL